MATSKYTVDQAGPRIESFLRTLMRDAGFTLSYTIEPGAADESDFETPDVVVKFTGEDVDLLLENKAELLLALEHLTTEMLRMSSDEHSRICFDANDHRALRIEELRLSAVTAAEKVKKTRVPFHFSPMNSRERRIIHLALRNETDVRSESVGAAPFRCVAIVPSEMKEVPAPPMHRPPMGGGHGGHGGGGRGPGGPGGPRRGGPPRDGRGGGPRRGGRPRP